MANVNAKMSNMKFVKDGDIFTAAMNDAGASHYLGRLNSDEAPTTATITLDGESTTVTAQENDWIVLQTKRDAYIWNGSAWVQFGGGGSDREYQKVDVVNSINTATPSASAPTGTPIAYYSYDPLTSSLSLFQMAQAGSKVHDAIMEKAWEAKTWSGNIPTYGDCVWTDGENIYYSNTYGPISDPTTENYILDKSTSTWNTKSWTGLTSFFGSQIWTDGEDIYYSSNNPEFITGTYVLDKSTSTWSEKTWTGFTNISGVSVWTDGENVYYSSYSNQYVLDKSTSTWTAKSWIGLTEFSGEDVWTDGNNIYYSDGSSQYVLDKSTSTWSAKSWSGLTEFYGFNIWTDGDNIYYSNYSGGNYVLNKSTSTWVEKTWSGLTPTYGGYIWTDGDNIYYSSYSSQYQLIER